MLDISKSLDLETAVDHLDIHVTPTFFYADNGVTLLGLVSGAVLTFSVSSDRRTMEQDPHWQIPDALDPRAVSYVRKLRDTKTRYLILAHGASFVWEPA